MAYSEASLRKRKGSMEKKIIDTMTSGEALTTNGIADDAVTTPKMTMEQFFTLFLSGTLGNDTGINSEGVILGEFTPSAVGFALADDGTVFTDETTEANSAGADDMTLLPATPAVNDAYYLGHATKKFCAIKLNQGIAGSGTWTILVEYWNGTAWATLTTGLDTVTDFTVGTSTYFITFEPPSDWATTTVDSNVAYWVRWRVSAYTSVTTQPKGTQAWLYLVDTGNGVPMPNAGTLSKATLACITKSATNNDSVFLVVNLTQGTWDTITYTKGLAIDIDATLSLAVAQDDEIVILQLNEDGTTEYADVNLLLNLTL